MIKTISLVFIAILLVIVSASAYEVSIRSPTTILTGAPVVVNGTTDLPPGESLNVVFSWEHFGSQQIANETVVVQGNPEINNFSVIFNTTGLVQGQYKVEVPPISGYSFLGDSVTLLPITIVDRSSEIETDTSLKKIEDGTLVVSGKDQELRDSTIQLTVIDPDGLAIFGPAFIPTNTLGEFSKTLTINKTGNYTADFSDGLQAITNITYIILPKPVPELIIAPGTPATPAPVSAVSADSVASVDNPAIFSVVAHPGTVRIYTSTGIDWVLEYLGNDGTIHRVHNTGTTDPETATFQSDGTITWVKVTPYKYEDNSTVTLYAENAIGVQADKSGATKFTPDTANVPATTQKSPVPSGLVAGAIATGMALFSRMPIKKDK